MKKFLKEFKEFTTKGNVLNLAVGVIIGGAFQKIVTSAVNDLIMPLVGLLTGNSSFDQQFVMLKLFGRETQFNYGSFLSAVFDFLIMAFIIFIMVKGINNFTKLAKGEFKNKAASDASSEKEAVPPVPETKTCPYCLSEIPFKALKCAHCSSDLPIEEENASADT